MPGGVTSTATSIGPRTYALPSPTIRRFNFMSEVINDNVNVTGGFSAGNCLFGTAKVSITEVNTPVSHHVSSINPMGTGDGGTIGTGGLVGFVTARSAQPWSRVKEVSVSGHEGQEGTLQPTQFDIYIFRTSQVDTDVHWMIWREP